MGKDTENEIFYKTYSRKILGRKPLAGHTPYKKIKSVTVTATNSALTTMPSIFEMDKSYTIDGPSFQQNCSPFKNKPESPNSPSNRASISRYETHYSYANVPTFLGQPTWTVFSKEGPKSIIRSSITSSEHRCFEGQNPLILEYNPKNCILTKDMINTVEYKQDLINLLFGRLKNAKIKKLNDSMEEKFIKYCCLVEVLVIDPMAPELKEIFMENGQKQIISFEQIILLFPNVTDIFLRDTQLNLKIAYKIQKFIETKPSSKLERIYFSLSKPIKKRDVAALQKIIKEIQFVFVQSKQMIIKKV